MSSQNSSWVADTPLVAMRQRPLIVPAKLHYRSSPVSSGTAPGSVASRQKWKGRFGGHSGNTYLTLFFSWSASESPWPCKLSERRDKLSPRVQALLPLCIIDVAANTLNQPISKGWFTHTTQAKHKQKHEQKPRVNRDDAKHKHKKKERVPFSCACACVVPVHTWIMLVLVLMLVLESYV